MANFFDAVLGGRLEEVVDYSSAGEQQVQSARNALDFQRGMATQLRDDTAPLRELRNSNFNFLSDLTGGNRSRFYTSPE